MKNVTNTPKSENPIWRFPNQADIELPIGTRVRYRHSGRFWRDSREYESIGVIMAKNLTGIKMDNWSYTILNAHDGKLDYLIIEIIEIL